MCFNVFSQNIKKDIASINEVYKKTEKLSMIFELNMFENYTTQKVYYTQNGLIQKYGANTFQKFDENQFINAPDYSVIVDDEEKEIVYAPKKKTFNLDDKELLIDLDSVLLLCKKYTFKKNSDILSSYDFEMLDQYPEYNRITLYFNSKMHLIQKIVFFCEEDDISINNQEEILAKARVEINYKDINLKPNFVQSDFTYEKFLVKRGNKFELKPNYKSYNLTVLSF